MKRLCVLLGLALFGAVMVKADVALVYNADISVTQTNSIINFTDNGSGGTSVHFRARYLLVRSLSTSANTCFFDIKDSLATTADTALEPGASISPPLSGEGIDVMSAICSTGQTATFRVTAIR